VSILLAIAAGVHALDAVARSSAPSPAHSPASALLVVIGRFIAKRRRRSPA
jgi:hypothetical protein